MDECSTTAKSCGAARRQDDGPAARPMQTGVFAIAYAATVSCARQRWRSVRRRSPGISLARFSVGRQLGAFAALRALTDEAPAGAIGPSVPSPLVFSDLQRSRSLQDRGVGFRKGPVGCYRPSTARISDRSAPDAAPNRHVYHGQVMAPARASGYPITQIERLTFRVPEYSADGIASLLANLGRQSTSPLGRPRGSSRVSWAGLSLSRFPTIPQPVVSRRVVESRICFHESTTRPPSVLARSVVTEINPVRLRTTRLSPGRGPHIIMPCRPCVDELPWMLQFINKYLR
ncbi:hypothetical protein QBC39DRAFT_133397 [Podospora conica]|nr:hypothetical protein QBC39DRAFT_133397 [Schizothecium conicum]